MSTLNKNSRRQRALQTKELVIFSMLGTLMYCSKVIMSVLPNIHLLGMLTMTYTVAYRTKALIPIYIYVILDGLFSGFNFWWLPYLYIWTILWALTMLLPKKMPFKIAGIVYPIICALHGFAFGTLYAPAQALMFGLNFEQTVAWIIAGIPFDVIHGVSNIFTGMLVIPFSELIKKLSGNQNRS